MRILLDACVPRGIRKSLPEHEVFTAPEMGWADLDNGDLLEAMTGRFDILVTVDQGIPNQQHLRGRPQGLVILRAKTNRLRDLLPLVPALRLALIDVKPGSVKQVAG